MSPFLLALIIFLSMLGIGMFMVRFVEKNECHGYDDEFYMIFGLGGLLMMAAGIVMGVIFLLAWIFGWGIFG